MIAAVLKIEAGDWIYEDDLGIPNLPQFFFCSICHYHLLLLQIIFSFDLIDLALSWYYFCSPIVLPIPVTPVSQPHMQGLADRSLPPFHVPFHFMSQQHRAVLGLLNQHAGIIFVYLLTSSQHRFFSLPPIASAYSFSFSSSTEDIIIDFRERKGGERKRNKDVREKHPCVASPTCLDWDQTCNIGMCLDWDWNRELFGCMGRLSNQLCIPAKTNIFAKQM